MELSVIIPAYNESDRIVPTLKQTLSYLQRCPYSSEVLVVSDGSSDDTVAVVEGMPAAGPVVLKALSYHPNRGKGYAVKYGMQRAAGRYRLFMDADYSVPIGYVDKALDMVRNGKDVAIASRSMPGAVVQHHQNVFREMSAKLYTAVQNCYLGISYKDTQCGFKLFSETAARELFNRQKLNSVIFDPEILWLAQKMEFSVGQFPVRWTHIENSRIQYDSLKKSLFVFQELFRIKGLHPDIR